MSTRVGGDGRSTIHSLRPSLQIPLPLQRSSSAGEMWGVGFSLALAAFLQGELGIGGGRGAGGCPDSAQSLPPAGGGGRGERSPRLPSPPRATETHPWGKAAALSGFFPPRRDDRANLPGRATRARQELRPIPEIGWAKEGIIYPTREEGGVSPSGIPIGREGGAFSFSPPLHPPLSVTTSFPTFRKS